MDMNDPWDLLLSLPPNICGHLAVCEPAVAAGAFATFDPPDRQLGSGGATAYVLEQAWRASGEASFAEWLRASGKLIVHCGGESRRLPPYAASGKLFIPVPVFRWAHGHRLDQTLLDLIVPTLRKLARAAPSAARVMIASGDVLIRTAGDALPPVPDADVVLFGLWVKPEEAHRFGVLFCDRYDPRQLVTFLQKPSPDTIREWSRDHTFLVDVGIWLLSERAIDGLMRKSGWDARRQAFGRGVPETYDLYGKWALHLGARPSEPDPEIGALRVAVVPLAETGFYHFGACRDMLQSVYELQNLEIDQTRLGSVPTLAQPRQFVQNAIFKAPLRREENDSLWVENSHIPASWRIATRNILTGVPENDWSLELEDGVCLDFVPFRGKTAVRVYDYDDAFRGAVGCASTCWLNRPFERWLEQRGLSLEEAGINPATDLQLAPLFPLAETIDPGFLKWLFAAAPATSDTWRHLWLSAPRVSARQLAHEADLCRLYRQRDLLRLSALPAMAKNAEHSVFYKLDLEATAECYARSPHELPPSTQVSKLGDPLIALHSHMFRAAVRRHRQDAGWRESEREAFHVLHELIVEPCRRRPVLPACSVQADQIVWGRSPLRLDFAGGWSDTPPYCMEFGGSVLNVAVELNGQPPIQVFARRTSALELSIRSIDLGLAERLKSYEDVRAYDRLGDGFAVARAAFALAGFHPDFNGAAFPTLEEQLSSLGGGVEISMLAAVPKGSGLGTSSILAATILGVLADFARLDWDRIEILRRTMALEQMLTSGGGWQDQAGGVFPGVKQIETSPGLEQHFVCRWLPDRFFRGARKACMLLYYTGLKRVANDILGEIVRDIFLNSAARLETIHHITRNAGRCYDAIQRDDFEAFAEAIRRSWQLNLELDPGTQPPAVRQILDTAGSDLSAAKLLGAGGGGYLFMIANDPEGALRIRQRLEAAPPNAAVRFVDFSISDIGLQITRS